MSQECSSSKKYVVQQLVVDKIWLVQDNEFIEFNMYALRFFATRDKQKN